LGGLEPVSDVGWLLILFPIVSGRGRPLYVGVWIQTVGVGDPSQATGRYSGDAKANSVALTQFLLAIFE
jgi:hypothetical protein